MNETDLQQDEISDVLNDELSAFTEENYLAVDSDTLVSAAWINKFYKDRKYIPAWSNKGKLSSDADSFLVFINQLKSCGLNPGNYYASEIKARRESVYNSVLKKLNVTKLVEIDLLLTESFFKLCVHLHSGRINPDSLTVVWKGERMDTNAIAQLQHALISHTIRQALESLEPKAKQYHLLKKFLAEFRARFENNPWDSLPSPEEDTIAFYEKLRLRLVKSDDYDTGSAKNDSVKLTRAIQSFQRKHGLIADGKTGKNTLQRLNESAAEHIARIEMNMERWRWEQPFENRYIWINIPSYTFNLVDSDTVVIKSRIICGLPDKQSPELNSTVNYFIIYPYWNVPFSIAAKEILPILKRDTGYLRKHNIDVLDSRNVCLDTKKIKWKKFNETHFPFRLRQRDGDENTLGVLKFIFPNKFGVYLHDTNARNLFAKEIRALSHGCFRLEKAKELAEYLVNEDTLLFTVDSLHYYLKQKVQKRVNITPHLPIHVRYYTCQADTGGVIFYQDIYMRDKRMTMLTSAKH